MLLGLSIKNAKTSKKLIWTALGVGSLAGAAVLIASNNRTDYEIKRRGDLSKQGNSQQHDWQDVRADRVHPHLPVKSFMEAKCDELEAAMYGALAGWMANVCEQPEGRRFLMDVGGPLLLDTIVDWACDDPSKKQAAAETAVTRLLQSGGDASKVLSRGGCLSRLLLHCTSGFASEELQAALNHLPDLPDFSPTAHPKDVQVVLQLLRGRHGSSIQHVAARFLSVWASGSPANHAILTTAGVHQALAEVATAAASGRGGGEARPLLAEVMRSMVVIAHTGHAGPVGQMHHMHHWVEPILYMAADAVALKDTDLAHVALTLMITCIQRGGTEVRQALQRSNVLPLLQFVSTDPRSLLCEDATRMVGLMAKHSVLPETEVEGWMHKMLEWLAAPGAPQALKHACSEGLAGLSSLPGQVGLKVAHYWLGDLLDMMAEATPDADASCSTLTAQQLPAAYIRWVSSELRAAADAARGEHDIPPGMAALLDPAAVAVYPATAKAVDAAVADAKLCTALEVLCTIVAENTNRQDWLQQVGILPLLHRLVVQRHRPFTSTNDISSSYPFTPDKSWPAAVTPNAAASHAPNQPLMRQPHVTHDPGNTREVNRDGRATALLSRQASGAGQEGGRARAGVDGRYTNLLVHQSLANSAKGLERLDRNGEMAPMLEAQVPADAYIPDSSAIRQHHPSNDLVLQQSQAQQGIHAMSHVGRQGNYTSNEQLSAGPQGPLTHHVMSAPRLLPQLPGVLAFFSLAEGTAHPQDAETPAAPIKQSACGTEALTQRTECTQAEQHMHSSGQSRIPRMQPSQDNDFASAVKPISEAAQLAQQCAAFRDSNLQPGAQSNTAACAACSAGGWKAWAQHVQVLSHMQQHEAGSIGAAAGLQSRGTTPGLFSQNTWQVAHLQYMHSRQDSPEAATTHQPQCETPADGQNAASLPSSSTRVKPWPSRAVPYISRHLAGVSKADPPTEPSGWSATALTATALTASALTATPQAQTPAGIASPTPAAKSALPSMPVTSTVSRSPSSTLVPADQEVCPTTLLHHDSYPNPPPSQQAHGPQPSELLASCMKQETVGAIASPDELADPKWKRIGSTLPWTWISGVKSRAFAISLSGPSQLTTWKQSGSAEPANDPATHTSCDRSAANFDLNATSASVVQPAQQLSDATLFASEQMEAARDEGAVQSAMTPSQHMYRTSGQEGIGCTPSRGQATPQKLVTTFAPLFASDNPINPTQSQIVATNPPPTSNTTMFQQLHAGAHMSPESEMQHRAGDSSHVSLVAAENRSKQGMMSSARLPPSSTDSACLLTTPCTESGPSLPARLPHSVSSVPSLLLSTSSHTLNRTHSHATTTPASHTSSQPQSESTSSSQAPAVSKPASSSWFFWPWRRPTSKDDSPGASTPGTGDVNVAGAGGKGNFSLQDEYPDEESGGWDEPTVPLCLQRETARMLAMLTVHCVGYEELTGSHWLQWLWEASSSSDCQLSSHAARALLHLESSRPDAPLSLCSPEVCGVPCHPVFLDGVHLLNIGDLHHWYLAQQPDKRLETALNNTLKTLVDAFVDVMDFSPEASRISHTMNGSAGISVQSPAVSRRSSEDGLPNSMPEVSLAGAQSPGLEPSPSTDLEQQLGEDATGEQPVDGALGAGLQVGPDQGGAATVPQQHSRGWFSWFGWSGSRSPSTQDQRVQPTEAASSNTAPPVRPAAKMSNTSTQTAAHGQQTGGSRQFSQQHHVAAPVKDGRKPFKQSDAAIGQVRTGGAFLPTDLEKEQIAQLQSEFGLLEEGGRKEDKEESNNHDLERVAAGVQRVDVGEPLVDVVFIHGIQGGPFMTWRKEKNPKRSNMTWQDCWVSDWLVRDVPNARFLTLGYAAPMTAWQVETGTLVDTSMRLLQKLAAAGVGQRPVVFVVHSMGGLIVKEILARVMQQGPTGPYYSIFQETKAVAFYATPHFGSTFAALGWKWGVKPAPSIEHLVPGPHLIELNAVLHRLHSTGQLKVLSFVEGQATQIARVIPKLHIVPLQTGYPGFGDLVMLPQQDHVDACKPKGKQEPGYDHLLRLIRGVVSQAAAEAACKRRETEVEFASAAG